MANIGFETGVKEYTVNDGYTLRFAPTDIAFIERVYTALDNMDKKQEAYKAEVEAAKDVEIFDVARRMDAEARDEINAVFNDDVCTPVFGKMSLYTIADGFPVWANFLLALTENFEGAFADEKRKTNPRVAKYTAKYSKK